MPSSANPTPPAAAQRVVVHQAHGDDRPDPFYWLRERDDPDVRAYLEAENAFVEATMAPSAPLREQLFEELRSRVRETDESAPVPDGSYEYVVRTQEGSQYAIRVRRAQGGASGTETMVLDQNIVAAGHDYCAIGDLAVSPDAKMLAYTTDFEGGERYTLHVRDLATGEDLADVVDDVYYGVAWANDNRTLYFTRPDDAMRPHQIWRHTLGAPSADDVLVWDEPDEQFSVWLRRTRSGQYLTFGSDSRLTSEVWFVPADTPDGALRCVAPRTTGIEYVVEHRGDGFVVLSNHDGATNFAVWRAPIEPVAREQWTLLVPTDPEVRILDIDPFASFLVLHERTDGLERLRVVHDGSSTPAIVTVPDPVYSIGPGPNREYDAPRYRYRYSSLVQPPSDYDYDVATGASTLVRRQPVPNYDPDHYVAVREWATTDDGARVPISIVHRRDTPIDGSAPLLQYGYGAYEISIEPDFDPAVLPLLDRGWVYAIAHPRGGGEMGRTWWEDGRLAAKHHTFDDFVCCADHLVARGYGDASRIAARGRSAGGLLMGGIFVRSPDRWWRISAEVPFVDVITTMSDPTIPLTVNEYEEWGNPAEPDAYGWMREYSPYDNLRADVDYPELLLTAGLHDPRVQYWEPAKFAARLRQLCPDAHVLLRTEMGAGHGGPTGRYDAWRDEAFVLAWFLR